MTYASGTRVDESRTRGEIEQMLQKAGASAFGSFNDYANRKAQIGFSWKNLNIKLEVLLPAQDDKRFLRDGRGSLRSPAKQAEEYQAECRRRWRCLAMVLKAKLVAVGEGVTTLEREFLPYMVMANGRTFGEEMAPQIEAAKGGAVLALPSGEAA